LSLFNPQSAILNPQFFSMLKALELNGFKSFADRTRFEFPRGVSVVVGPNGSGKSNIVDAVKWVLGSQSAKSLRGQEMVDVIFNGSASRGPIGTAEVTLTLDNSDGVLPIDKAEVHVTRRVYRSGEGEYLIDRQPCRLRDIRELLAPTGITTEAYCIIEQGKVDLLLQSSPRDRRVIFEEAAGISQFKIKKAAAARRLERVEQNLLRLSDIVDEVESRLRSVRMQAGKARRYRDCTTRLQHLRTQVGLVDWRALTKRITERDEQLAALHRKEAACGEAVAELEARDHDFNVQQQSVVEQRREIESRAADTRERIAALEASLVTQSARRGDVEHEIARYRRQLAAMTTRAGSASDQLRDAAAGLRSAEAELVAADHELRHQLDESNRAQQEAVSARAAVKQHHSEYLAAVRNIASLENQQVRLESRLQATRDIERQNQAQLQDIQREHDAHIAQLAECEQQESAARRDAEVCQTELQKADERLSAARHEITRVERQLRQIEGRLSRTRERIAVLTELHQRLEGLNSGVRDVLLAARRDPEGPFGEVCGVVADLFQVDVDSAPLVDAALGEQAQYLVLATANRFFEWLNSRPLGVPGRVGFLQLDARAPADRNDEVDLSAEPGVMGRADRFVETVDEFAPLVRRLLGSTWFVDRLSTALRLGQTSGRGLDFVTSDGELLRADGTLVVGPRQASTGLLSRRSELRSCHQQLAELEKQLLHLQAVDTRLDAERSDHQRRRDNAANRATSLAASLAEHRRQFAAARGQLEQLTRSVDRVVEELQQSRDQAASIERELESIRQDTRNVEQASAEAQRREQAAIEQLRQLEEQVAARQVATTEKRVASAKCEERVELLRNQLAQDERDQQERDAALAETQHRLANRELQLEELDRTTLAERQSLADLFLHKQQHVCELDQHVAFEEQLRCDRQRLQEQLRRERAEFADLQSQQHKLDVATNKLRHERQTLAERMQDDYRIDLAKAANEPASANDELDQRDTVEQEIADLRNQINQIGAVNLDALEELDDLESRFGGLSQQYRDLVDAKASLERVVQRINVDSRQLFLATLEVVRGHFRELFRRLFGGGEADILIDDAEDVLECGIEIVACPPGKEACNISLLSGGEKTLTCVALLLAVFRSKPSPFCVLDEVDAALDEANIGRFVQVLREFLSFTQFVVVTHSKKTMSGADTLYGVTMEESGVSKQVSVRFEDVSEDGQIRSGGLRRDESSPQSEAGQGPSASNRRAA
jgi:chromosome segregation protein